MQQSEQLTPSFFEVTGQDALVEAGRRALHFALNVFAARNARIRKLAEYSDEVYSSLLLIADRYCLDSYDASFAEHIMGLKRVGEHDSSISYEDGKSGRQQHQALDVRTAGLTRKQKRWSLVFLVIVPYLRKKLSDWYARETRATTRDNNNNHHHRVKRVLLKLYPWLHAVIEGSQVLFQLGYLIESTPYNSVFLWILRLHLLRLSATDMANQDKFVGISRQRLLKQISNLPFFIRHIFALMAQGWHGIVDNFQTVLWAVFVAFKLCQWWYASEKDVPVGSLAPIPPPPMPPSKPQAETSLVPSGVCPLCKNALTNTCLCPSGYVFCYPCIYPFVEEHRHCPITDIPCNPEQLRRIFEEQDPV